MGLINSFLSMLRKNKLPIANAGVDKSITLPTNSVTLVGSGSDSDGRIVSYRWTKISGPTGGTIVSQNSSTTNITGLTVGTHIYQLKVTDNKGAVATDTARIVVVASANIPPTADAGVNQTITLPANSIVLSGSGTDSDGVITTFSWVKTSGPASGTITSPSAASTTVTGLVAGTYVFTLTVTDNNSATASDSMTVVVNSAVNLPPTADVVIRYN